MSPASLTPTVPPTLPLPQRLAGAVSGEAVLLTAAGEELAHRHLVVAEQVLSGNVPNALRSLRPVRLSAEGIGEVTIWVTPDVLAIGGEDDHVRCPLGGPAALQIARQLGCWLPTRRIVDAVHAQADIRLTPLPMPPTARMTSNPYFIEHQRQIAAQLAAMGEDASGRLVAGHKKDLVLTPLLRQRPGRVAIYGWHQPGGEPIQPLSTVHAADYADYSHGVRLVWGQVEINGDWRDFAEVLRDPALAPLLSDEGAFDPEGLMLGEVDAP